MALIIVLKILELRFNLELVVFERLFDRESVANKLSRLKVIV